MWASGVVIATDMFGGTPCNLALTLLERGKIEVLAGANLPSLIKLIDIRTKRAAGAGGERSHRGGPQIYARRQRGPGLTTADEAQSPA